MSEADDLVQLGYRQELKRSLNVWLLTAFGVNYMIPLAPAIIFGLVAATSGTTVALPYLLAFIGMFFTANSYSIMVQKFPVSGSLYSYVSRGVSPHWGFVAGWILLLDYIFIPTVTAVSAVLYFRNYFPQLPFGDLLISYILITGLLNLIGVDILAKVGLLLLVVSEAVLVLSFVFWGHHAVVVHDGPAVFFSSLPFHFSGIPALLTATSIAVLCYLGFDAITTLAEEANHPRRDIPRAIFMSLCIGALTMFLCGYLGVLASPHIASELYNPHWQDTALFYISRHSGGEWLAEIFTAGFILSMFVFNIVATTAASRLLFGMGRDGVLPKPFFGRVNQHFKTPHYNILLIMAIEIILGLLLSVESISEMVNFGALVGFSLLNIAVIYQSIKNWRNPQEGRQVIRQILFPLLGLVVLVGILVSMRSLSLMVGLIWLGIGVLYGSILSRGYQKVPVAFR